MTELNTSNIDNLIKSLENEIDLLERSRYGNTAFYGQKHRDIDKIKERIMALEIERAKILDSSKIKVTPIKEIEMFTLGDIIIIPLKFFIIGNYAISDDKTFGEFRDMLERGKISCAGVNYRLDKNFKTISQGQTSGGLKFLYAILKYINIRKIKQDTGKYAIEANEEFMRYFREAGEIFTFFGKVKSKTPIDKSADFLRSNRNYANKVLQISTKVSILPKDAGKRTNIFFVQENK